MILDLDDGREIQLPDNMSDEAARQLKRLILGAEERARAAESEVRLLRDEMAAMRKTFEQARTEQRSQSEVVAAIDGLQKALRAIEHAVNADRVMIMDEYGEYTRSRRAR